uniref:SH3 domain-containing protein n=1 Tax=Panagrellus redivivus TaxID=6233 RepID=A0A7E4VHK3_PANRE
MFQTHFTTTLHQGPLSPVGGSRPSTSDDGYQSESQRNQYQSISPEVKQNLDSLPTARARYDWQGSNSQQLTIRYGETLRVTKLGQTWVQCANKNGLIGWVPSSQVYLMPSGFL